MNERIRELVKQAGGRFSTHTLTSYPAQHRESIELWDNNIEKFAELIVAECVNMIEAEAKNADDDSVHGMRNAAGLISRAFITLH